MWKEVFDYLTICYWIIYILYANFFNSEIDDW